MVKKSLKGGFNNTGDLLSVWLVMGDFLLCIGFFVKLHVKIKKKMNTHTHQDNTCTLRRLTDHLGGQ